jgi:hypothetical protein|tara:strand:+ start:1348 stop:1470 length:123 start_codon:yes stop_codon:yes gene_type:complete
VADGDEAKAETENKELMSFLDEYEREVGGILNSASLNLAT